MKNDDTNMKYRIILAALAAEYIDEGADIKTFPSNSNSWPVEAQVDSTAKVLATERQRQILDALKRLDDGTYGVCDECGSDIAGARLDVIPEAPLCVDCQRRQEQKLEVLAKAQDDPLYDQLM